MLPCSLPLKCKNMAEQDIREDQMTITNTVDYLRGIKGKDSILIAPGNLLSALFQYRGIVQDANNSLGAGYYTVNSSAIPNIPYAGYGILVVFKAYNYIIQLYLYGDGIKQRKSPDIGVSWGDWKSITFT